ncbi:proton-conducting transporter membrane subunit [Pilimelia columellifera]|uniref:NADH:quinone oxidoreductase/Mrp antiporter transmembrane domain-containing protein n=1 Tax=Pilimelia columellifera subsp. columellifera TaxID=706583 RepID=A0ABP6AV46_9ACTN
MSPLPELALAAIVAAGSAAVTRADPRGARRTAAGLLTAAVVVSAVLWTGDAGGWPTVVAFAVALVAVSVAPVAEHPSRVLGAILQVVAISVAAAAAPHPATAPIAWAALTAVVWLRLGGETPVRRLLIIHHGPAVALLAAAALIGTRHPTAAGALGAAAVLLRWGVAPGHAWLPSLAEAAPAGLVVVYTVGTPLTLLALPEHLGAGGPLVAGVGAVTAMAAAGVAAVQRRVRRAVAWILVSQAGTLAIGLGAAGPATVRVGWCALAMAGAGLVMAVAAVEARRGPLTLDEPAGAFGRFPRLAAGFLVAGLSVTAFPLLLGFSAESELLEATAGTPLLWLPVLIAAAGNAVTVLRCYFALSTGGRAPGGQRDITRLEAYGLTVALVGLLVGGLAPPAHRADPGLPPGAGVPYR